MSNFIELHTQGDDNPVLVNLNDVRWITKTEQGKTLIKFIPRLERNTQPLAIYQDSYEKVRASMYADVLKV